MNEGESTASSSIEACFGKYVNNARVGRNSGALPSLDPKIQSSFRPL